MKQKCPHCGSVMVPTPLVAGKTWLCTACAQSFGVGKPVKKQTVRRPGGPVVRKGVRPPHGKVQSRRHGTTPREQARSTRRSKGGEVRQVGPRRRAPMYSIMAAVGVLVVIGIVAGSLFFGGDAEPRPDKENGKTARKPAKKPVTKKDPKLTEYEKFQGYHQAKASVRVLERRGDYSSALDVWDEFLRTYSRAIERMEEKYAKQVADEVDVARKRLKQKTESQWSLFEEKLKREGDLAGRIRVVQSELLSLDSRNRVSAMEDLLPEINGVIAGAFHEADLLKAGGDSIPQSAKVREGLKLTYEPDIRRQVDLLLKDTQAQPTPPPSFLFVPLRALAAWGTPEAMSLAGRMIDRAAAAPELAAKQKQLMEIRDKLNAGRKISLSLIDVWVEEWDLQDGDIELGDCGSCGGNGRVTCGACSGQGATVKPCTACKKPTRDTTPRVPTRTCRRCNGTAKVRHIGPDGTLKLNVDTDLWRLSKANCSNCGSGIRGIVEYPVERDKMCRTCNGFGGRKYKSKPLKFRIAACDERGRVASESGKKCKELSTVLRSRIRQQTRELGKLRKGAKAWVKWGADLDKAMKDRLKEKAKQLNYRKHDKGWNRLESEKSKLLEEFSTLLDRARRLISDIDRYEGEIKDLSSDINDLEDCKDGSIACSFCSRRKKVPTPDPKTPGKTECGLCKGTREISQDCDRCAGMGGSRCTKCLGLGSAFGLIGPWNSLTPQVIKQYSLKLVARLESRPKVPRAAPKNGRPKDWKIEEYIPARLNGFKVRFERPLDTRRRTAVESALQWLAVHQSADGGWHRNAYVTECRKRHRGVCAPVGTNGPYARPEYDCDVALTALAVQAFLGAGFTELSEAEWGGQKVAESVQSGLKYLVSKQDDEGCIGDRALKGYMEGHAIAAAALAEAYGMTGARAWKAPAEKAVAFLLNELSPGKGLSLAFQGSKANTPVTGWGLMALKSAELAGLKFEHQAAYAGALKWINLVTKKGDGGRWETHYNMFKPHVTFQNASGGGKPTPAMTAVGLLCRAAIGDPDGRQKAEDAVKTVGVSPPGAGDPDFYYWYHAALGLQQAKSASADAWLAKLADTLIPLQNGEGAKKGSWESDTLYCQIGGRVYATAINALTLEAGSRYPALRR